MNDVQWCTSYCTSLISDLFASYKFPHVYGSWFYSIVRSIVTQECGIDNELRFNIDCIG